MLSRGIPRNALRAFPEEIPEFFWNVFREIPEHVASPSLFLFEKILILFRPLSLYISICLSRLFLPSLSRLSLSHLSLPLSHVPSFSLLACLSEPSPFPSAASCSRAPCYFFALFPLDIQARESSTKVITFWGRGASHVKGWRSKSSFPASNRGQCWAPRTQERCVGFRRFSEGPFGGSGVQGTQKRSSYRAFA